jgi:hypothetical protein
LRSSSTRRASSGSRITSRPAGTSHIEDVVHDRRRGGAEVLKGVERRAPVLVEGDDLAVDQGVVEELRQAFTMAVNRALKSLLFRDCRWSVPSRLNTMMRYHVERLRALSGSSA